MDYNKFYYVMALIGESGTGKDSLMKKLFLSLDGYDEKDSFNKVIPVTTRPPRDYEVNGVDYRFVKPEEFNKFPLVEKEVFNNWWYGTTTREYGADKVNIGIYSPSSVSQLMRYSNMYVEVYKIEADGMIRLDRLVRRGGDPDEICRR